MKNLFNIHKHFHQDVIKSKQQKNYSFSRKKIFFYKKINLDNVKKNNFKLINKIKNTIKFKEIF